MRPDVTILLAAYAINAAFVTRAAPLVRIAPSPAGDSVEFLVGNLYALFLGKRKQLLGSAARALSFSSDEKSLMLIALGSHLSSLFTHALLFNTENNVSSQILRKCTNCIFMHEPQRRRATMAGGWRAKLCPQRKRAATRPSRGLMERVLREVIGAVLGEELLQDANRVLCADGKLHAARVQKTHLAHRVGG